MHRILAATLIAYTPFLFPATYTWNSNGGNWTTNGNWSIPTFPQNSADTAIFNDRALAAISATVPAATLSGANLLQFGPTVTTAYTINGATGPLTFYGTPNATLILKSGGTRNHIITCPTTLPTGVLNVIHEGGATGDITISGKLSGSGGITKSVTGVGSVGVLRLSSTTNAYVGPTTVSSGTISYDANGCIPAGNVVTVGSGVAGTSQLIINASMASANAFPITINSPDGALIQNSGRTTELISLAGSGNITLSSGTSNADLFDITGNSPTTTTISGVISGGALQAVTPNNFTVGNRITKTGTSTQVFSGPNTYLSRTFIGSGILRATQDASLGNPATNQGVYVRSGATLELGAGPLTLAQPIFLNGFGVSSAGAIRCTGNNTIGPGIYGTTSKLTIGWAGSVEVSSSASIQVDSGKTLTIAEQIDSTGTRDLTLFGGGSVIYTGNIASTHNGQTIIGTPLSSATLNLNMTPGIDAISADGEVIINNGTLFLSNTNQISNGAPVTINGSTALFNMNGFDDGIFSLTFNQGTLNQGVGQLSLITGGSSAVTALTMRGGTTINGPIRISSAGKIYFDASTAVPLATISSLASLSINRGFPDTAVFDIEHVAAAPVDMEIDAPILEASGSSSISIQKIGLGILQFGGSAANIYSGLTTVSAGTLRLAKTVSNVAIPGDVLINGGSLTLSSAEQINNSSVVQIDSGSFVMNGFDETIGQLNYFGGTLDQTSGSPTLKLGSATALNMRNTTISGKIQTIGGGSINFDATSGAPAVFASTSTLDLNFGSAFTTQFNIATAAAIDMQILGPIINTGVGAASIQKIGPGVLQFGGSAANTYLGLTTVSAGTLNLAKTVSNVAIPGDVLINGGSLTLSAAEQIINSSVVEIDSGSFVMNGFNETIKELKYFGGTLNQTAGGTLILNDPTTALLMRDTTINGALQITNAGKVEFDPTNNGTAQILGPLDLNNNIVEFAIPSSSATYSMIVASSIANGGLKKTQAGRLALTGTNSYPLGTTVLGGVLEGNSLSLQGAISNSATLDFNQNFPGVFAGSISGLGAFQKTGSDVLVLTGLNSTGAAEVVSGELRVNGTLSGGNTLTVDAAATLSGNGTIQKNIDLFGRLSPGVGYDSITLIGAHTFESGSVTQFELSPTASDSIDIQGTLTINPGTVLNLIIQPGQYNSPSLYPIIDTTAGVFGTFSTVEPPIPLANATLLYTANNIFLKLAFLNFSQFIKNGNAAQVAHCLDGFNPPPASDLAKVINYLRLSPTMADLQTALDEISPSQLTALALSQESSTIYVRNSFFNRLEELFHSCLSSNKTLSFWVSGFEGFIHQSDQSQEWGYSAKSPGISCGVDAPLGNSFILGMGTGYTHNDLTWKHKRGEGEIKTLYGNLYGAWQHKHLFIEGALMGGYNWYEANRNLKFVSLSTDMPSIERSAQNHHQGYELSGHLKTVWSYNHLFTKISPYASLDYLLLHQDGYRERGAKSLNLSMHKKNSDLLLSEAGLDFSFCRKNMNVEFSPFLQLSYIRESRWMGAHQIAGFNGCYLDVTGLNPSRNLLGVGAGANLGFRNGSFLSLFAKWKSNSNYRDVSVYLEYSY